MAKNFNSLEGKTFDFRQPLPVRTTLPHRANQASLKAPSAIPVSGKTDIGLTPSMTPLTVSNMEAFTKNNACSAGVNQSRVTDTSSDDGASVSGTSSDEPTGSCDSTSESDKTNSETHQRAGNPARSSDTTPSSERSKLEAHLRLLETTGDLDELNEITTSPIFTEAIRKHASSLAASSSKKTAFTQYGLLAGVVATSKPSDPRIFQNVASPSSVFICGSQGSGKSHTLSCLLENCLIPSQATNLPRPLTGLVFHYDTFISDTGGSPCEVAYLSSSKDISVRVLCPPTNTRTIKSIYSCFRNIRVEELRLNQSDLNTKRMLDLMAVNSGAAMPLYLHVIRRILRDLRIRQQQTGGSFDYAAFKRMVDAEDLTEHQIAPLKQRLDTLESFMVKEHTAALNMLGTNKPAKGAKKVGTPQGNDWTPKARQLTIVDLSCPCVTAETACSLFNICLSLFLEQNSATVGRLVALDEAHKYMTDSSECVALTESLLATIRLQRHLGARVIISTQEPTISPKLLDLCSVTIVHRFTSPDWLASLRKHLAGVSSAARLLGKADGTTKESNDDEVDPLVVGTNDPAMELFSRIVGLRVGEALLFAPSAAIGVGGADGRGVKRLSHGVLKVRIRNRMTADGGRSVMAA